MYSSSPCYSYAPAYGSSPLTSPTPLENVYHTFPSDRYLNTPENSHQPLLNPQYLDTPLENSCQNARYFDTPTETDVDMDMDISVDFSSTHTPTIQPIADSTLVDLTEPYLMDWCTNSGPFMLMMQEWYD